MPQHTFPIHDDVGKSLSGPCKGILHFRGFAIGWSWWKFRCNGCGEMLAAGDEEAARYVSDIPWQSKLELT